MPIDTNEFLKLADVPLNGAAPKPFRVVDGGAEDAGKWRNIFTQHPESGGAFGGRDNALFKLVAFLRAKSVPYEGGLDFCHWWNRRYCLPPLAEEDIHEKVSRAWAEWTEGGHEDANPEDFQAKKKQEERQILTIDDLLDLEESGKGMEWLVPNVFVRSGIHFLSAPAAGAKSWLMLDLSRCLVSGAPWLGQYEIPQGAVLYVDEEMGQAKTSKRVKQLGFGRGLPFFYLGKQGIRIFNKADLKLIVDTCKEKQTSLVCIDTLTSVFPGLKENESEHVSLLRSYFNEITETGATLIVAHHDRKNGQGEGDIAHYRMAGSRDFGAMADMAYGIDKRGSFFHLSVTKNRLLADEDTIEVDFAIEDNEDKERVTLRVLDSTERSDRVLTTVERRITACLQKNGRMNTNTLCDNVQGTKAAVIAALTRLVDAEEVICERIGNAKFYDLPGAG
jgi:AAA domain